MKEKVVCKDVFGNEYEVDVNELDVRTGVYAVIVKDGALLLTRQWDGYSLIGGGVEKGETPEEAFIREVKEETGLNATPGSLIHHATTFFKRNADATPRQSLQLYFTAASIDGTISNDSITDSEKTYTNDVPEWVTLDKLSDITFRHSVDLETIMAAHESAK